MLAWQFVPTDIDIRGIDGENGRKFATDVQPLLTARANNIPGLKLFEVREIRLRVVGRATETELAFAVELHLVATHHHLLATG